MNTASRRNSTRSGSVSSACDQSTEARKVCWRRTAVRAPPVNSRNRSCRLSRISVNDSARTRAAANSIASGTPSRRRQISVTVAALSSSTTKSGRARRARSTNSSIALSANGNDGTRQLSSPATPIGSRLVVSRVNLGPASSNATISVGAGIQQMLAVVQHHQHPPVGDEPDAMCPSWSGRVGRVGPARGQS